MIPRPIHIHHDMHLLLLSKALIRIRLDISLIYLSLLDLMIPIEARAWLSGWSRSSLRSGESLWIEDLHSLPRPWIKVIVIRSPPWDRRMLLHGSRRKAFVQSSTVTIWSQSAFLRRIFVSSVLSISPGNDFLMSMLDCSPSNDCRGSRYARHQASQLELLVLICVEWISLV